MNEETTTDLAARLSALEPTSVLLVGMGGRILLESYLHSHPTLDFRVLDWPEVEESGDDFDRLVADARYDLGIVCWTEPSAPPTCTSRTIARLRDLQARRLWVLTTLGEPDGGADEAWTAHGLVALGLTRAGRFLESRPHLYLYTYDLESYKTTPQWLGPKHWAHPDRWDKDRW